MMTKSIISIAASILLTLATIAWAATPAKQIDIDVTHQQLQALPTLSIQQGADMRLLVRPKLAGSWLNLTGVTASWEARSSMESAEYYGAASVWSSNAIHQIAIDLAPEQTGTTITNWVYSILLISGGNTYPVGTGRVDIVASTFTSAPGTLLTTDEWARRSWVTDQIEALPGVSNMVDQTDIDSTIASSQAVERARNDLVYLQAESDPVALPRINTLEAKTNTWDAKLSAETDPAALPRITTLESKTNSWDAKLSTESDPVALPRIETLEAKTNSWDSKLSAETDPAAIPRITTLESKTNSWDAKLSAEVDPAAIPRIETLEAKTNSWDSKLSAESDPAALPRIEVMEAKTNSWDAKLSAETDPVALPRIETLEAKTNSWDAKVDTEVDPAAIPRIETIEAKTNSWDAKVDTEVDPAAIPRIEVIEAKTNSWDSKLSAESDPIALPRIETIEAKTNSWDAKVDTEVDPAAIPRIEAIEAETNKWNAMSAYAPQTLTYVGTHIATDASLTNSFRVTLTNNATLDAPSGLSDGQIIKWWITQGGDGSYTLTTDAIFVLPTGITSLSLSTAVGSKDCLIGEYDGVAVKVNLTGLLLFGE